MKISQRLKTISDFVIKDSITADIGTDHGYLLKYLLDEKKIIKGFACDLNKKPLTYAEKNLREYILENKAELRLGSGLQPLTKEDDVQCVVIAGMGGKLMTEILEDGKNILEKVKRVILAPNLASEKVREFSQKKGWRIIEEELVLEDHKFYPIIVIEKGEEKSLTSGELFFGPCLIKKKHPLLKSFAEFEKEKLDKVISKMEQSENPQTKKEIVILENNWKEMSRCLNEL